MKAFAIILIVVSSGLLLVYPFVLLANLMSFASIGQADFSPIQKIGFFAFMGGSTLYPIPWLFALLRSIREIRKKDYGKALAYQLAIFAYLVVVVLAAMAWGTY